MRRPLIVTALLVTTACGGASPTAPATPNVAGNYTIRFNASSSCSQLLPAAYRNRTYSTVVVTQSGNNVTMTATTPLGTLPVVFATFTSPTQVAGGLEFHDNSVEFHVSGVAQIGISGNSLSTGTLNGAIYTLGLNSSCVAANHQVIFERR